MVKLKCANSRCGHITELPAMPKKFVCSECGVLNTPQPATSGSGDEACGCLLPEGFEWLLPAGEFEGPKGPEFATADDGTRLTLDQWIEDFGSDPRKLRAWMTKMGIEGRPGYANLSTLGRRQR